MKIGMTLLVRDESDIIESNLDYHLNNGIDFVLVTDNGSVDGTYELCERYLNQGVVEIKREPGNDFSQYAYVSEMANLAYSKYNADWVINADADEFFVSRNYANLKDALSGIGKEFGSISVGRHDYVPIKSDYIRFSPLSFPYRKKESLNLRGRPLPPKVIHRGSSNIKVSQGNHSVEGDGLGEQLNSSDIEVLHFPIRSYSQFESKVRNGGSGYANNKTLSLRTGFHKRYWYNLLLNNQLKTEYEKFFYDEKKLEQAIKEGLLIEDPFLAKLLE